MSVAFAKRIQDDFADLYHFSLYDGTLLKVPVETFAEVQRYAMGKNRASLIEKADEDKDGMIDVTEFQQYRIKMWNEELAREMFKLVDRDANGIDLEEFIKASKRKAWVHYYLQFDQNRDGKLSRSEVTDPISPLHTFRTIEQTFAKAMLKPNKDLLEDTDIDTDETWVSEFQRMDLNNDDIVSLEELRLAMNMDEQQNRLYFDTMDNDGNGGITADELERAYDHEDFEDFSKAIEKGDGEYDGDIKKDFAEFMKKEGLRAKNQDRAKKAMDRLDYNEDGKISWWEAKWADEQ